MSKLTLTKNQANTLDVICHYPARFVALKGTRALFLRGLIEWTVRGWRATDLGYKAHAQWLARRQRQKLPERCQPQIVRLYECDQLKRVGRAALLPLVRHADLEPLDAWRGCVELRFDPAGQVCGARVMLECEMGEME